MRPINKDLMFDGTDESMKFANRRYNLPDFKRKLSGVDMCIVHCTATDSAAWDNPQACINYDLNPNHISKRGCPTATYHFYVSKQGNIYQLVSMNYYTYNVSGQNKNSIAICINHGAVKDNVNPDQYAALVEGICHIFDFMDWSYDYWGVVEHLKFHRQFNALKTCPGKLDYEQLCKDVSAKLETWGDNS